MMKKEKIVLSSILCFSLFLFVFYLFQIGSLVEQGYLTEHCRGEIEELSKVTVSHYNKTTNLTSLSKAEEEIKELNFIVVNDITYIPLQSDILVQGK